MNASYRPLPSSTQLYLLADARGVNANALATTDFTFQNNATAATSIPMFARIFRKTGTLLLLVATLKLNGTVIQAVSATDAAFLSAGADPIQYPLSTAVAAVVVPIAGIYQMTVATINGSVSTIDAEIWGIRTS